MTFKTDDRVFETSSTAGTGDYTLDGAQVGFTAFSGMGANNLCPYYATDDTNWEVGIGTILTGPAKLQRTKVLRSSNADAAVNWGAGTRKLRCGLPAAMAVPRVLSKSVAGGVDVALTQDEQRRDVLILTGALTGNINVTVDATPWVWKVINNTTGAYSLTLKVTGLTGRKIQQGSSLSAYCDGTDVFGVDALGIKIGAFTRDMTLASGSQSITGLGFKPRAVIFFAGDPSSAADNAVIGFDDGSNPSGLVNLNAISAGRWFAPAVSIYLLQGGGTSQTASISSLDSDGFTLGWTKTGAPTGTMTIRYLAIR